MEKTVTNKLTKIWKDHDIRNRVKFFVNLLQTIVFLMTLYEFESWAVNKSSRRRLEAIEMTICRRMLRIPWTNRRMNASILRELNIQYSQKMFMIYRRMLKFFGHVTRVNNIEEITW